LGEKYLTNVVDEFDLPVNKPFPVLRYYINGFTGKKKNFFDLPFGSEKSHIME